MKRMLIVVSVDEDALLDTYVKERDGDPMDFDYAVDAMSELAWAEQSGIKAQEIVIRDVDATSGYSWTAKCAAAQNSIAIIWGLIDVQDTCKTNYGVELTDEQALEILSIVDRRHDANEGVNWIVLDVHIQMYLDDHGIQPKVSPYKVDKVYTGLCHPDADYLEGDDYVKIIQALEKLDIPEDPAQIIQDVLRKLEYID